MIDQALSFISGYLNQQIKMTYGLNEDLVVSGSLINPDGSITENMENRIVVSLINLEQETTVNLHGPYSAAKNNQYVKTNPPIFLNLYLLVAANYDSGNYQEALKILSSVISVFQANSTYSSTEFPELPSSLEQLSFEIFNVPISELSHIWSGIGAKYVPSIIYKVRLITIQRDTILEQVPSIGGFHGQNKLKK